MATSSAELFSFVILIERQARLLASAKRVLVEEETIEPLSSNIAQTESLSSIAAG